MALHARLSPSSSERWLICAGSVNASTGVRGGTNEYAEEGTAAHALLETCLRFGSVPEDHLGAIFHDRQPDEDMVTAVGHALDWIRGYLRQYPKSKLRIEHRAKTGLALNRDDCWGTLDVEIENPELDELVTADYKHGKGVIVEAHENPQLMLYGLGRRAELKKRFKRHRFVVIQPRGRHEEGPIREWVATAEQMDAFQEHAAARAKATDEPNAPRVAGEHCRWCPVRGNCRARVELSLEVASTEFAALDPLPTSLPLIKSQELTPAEIGYVLRQQAAVVSCLSEVAAHALQLLKRGVHIPGFKLVHGREGNREWVLQDEVKLTKLLLKFTGLPLDEVAPRSPISPTQTEKKLKAKKDKKALITLKKHVMRSPASETIAPDNDPRLEVKPTPFPEL